MAKEGSSIDVRFVDDLYFSALINEEASARTQANDDQVFQISDAKYAENLQFQEALMASIITTHMPIKVPNVKIQPHKTSSSNPIRIVEEIGGSSHGFCEICADKKEIQEMFRNQHCGHSFCCDCIGKHVLVKILDSRSRVVTCPSFQCRGLLEIDILRPLINRDVVNRWEEALCKSIFTGSKKFYCPFRDCSAMLVDDSEGGEVIRESECPNCRRLFCAQCCVPWHSGIGCEELQRLGEDERGKDDLMVRELAKSHNWRRCPNCKYYVEKTSGCLHMTCRCGFQFCYACGATWSNTHGGCQVPTATRLPAATGMPAARPAATGMPAARPAATRMPASRPTATRMAAATMVPAARDAATGMLAARPAVTGIPAATGFPAARSAATGMPAVRPAATRMPAARPAATRVPAATGMPAARSAATRVPVATGMPAARPAATGMPAARPAATRVPAARPAATRVPVATGMPAARPTATGMPAARAAATGMLAARPAVTGIPTATGLPTARSAATEMPAARRAATWMPAARPAATRVPAATGMLASRPALTGMPAARSAGTGMLAARPAARPAATGLLAATGVSAATMIPTATRGSTRLLAATPSSEPAAIRRRLH